MRTLPPSAPRLSLEVPLELVMDEYERFLRLHHSQLQKIPEHLWRTLHYKLQAEVVTRDIGR